MACALSGVIRFVYKACIGPLADARGSVPSFCLNQILVTAGSKPSRARKQADTELTAFTNNAAKASPFGEAPDLRLLTIREEIRWGTIIGVDSLVTDHPTGVRPLLYFQSFYS
ncbi:hypothetical protein Lwal_0438 [Legionella waltersii]|uniref:Uncharacterized protein n=1 Tax=Legionella waltersii TaxID=66969 RepID=A0A0W1AN72_9GAMM|nr:hypothetical protein Lwal_0438 [Legionella waltersii]SNV03350.1 Uncharacterised protein [Legionella waltersii]